MALGGGHLGAGLEPVQLALGFGDQAWRAIELLAQVVQPLFAGVAVLEHAQRLLEGLLQRQLLGLRQFAVGQGIQALLDISGLGRLFGVRGAQAETQEKQDEG